MQETPAGLRSLHVQSPAVVPFSKAFNLPQSKITAMIGYRVVNPQSRELLGRLFRPALLKHQSQLIKVILSSWFFTIWCVSMARTNVRILEGGTMLLHLPACYNHNILYLVRIIYLPPHTLYTQRSAHAGGILQEKKIIQAHWLVAAMFFENSVCLNTSVDRCQIGC